MMLQKKRIKTEGARNEIPDAASPQHEGIVVTIKPRRGEKGEFDRGFNYAQKTGKHKPGKLARRKRGKRLKLLAGVVGLERLELPTIYLSVEGTSYLRAHAEGKGRSQEILLRHGKNLETMVMEVRRVVQEAIRSGVFVPLDKTTTASNRGLTLIHGLCADFEGVDARLFETTKGRQMHSNFAFRMMLYQFFRHVHFAGKAVGVAAADYYRANKAAPSFHTEPQMASGFATVDGVYYNRHFPAGDREAELIVRLNLEKFIRGALSAAKAARGDGRDSRDTEKYCYPPEGSLSVRDFETPDGLPLKDNKLFRRAISQFFCDTEMVKQVIGQSLGKT